MKLTEAELKTLNRWRKQQRNWPIARWLVITSGTVLVFLVAYSLYVGAQEFSRYSDEITSIIRADPDHAANHLAEFISLWRSSILVLACFLPFWISFAVLAFAHFTIAIKNWRGHAERDLLLKIVDAVRAQKTEDQPSAN